MSDSPAQLRFRIDKGQLKLPDLVTAARKAMQDIAPLAVVRAAVSPEFWVAAARSTADLVGQLVDVPLADVLVAAWKTHRNFKKFTDPRLYPPGKSTTVPLATHHITVSQKPSIEILLDGKSQGKIPFELELDLAVDAGDLVIQDGRFMRLEAGRVKATGTLKCAGTVVAERASREFEWKDGITFGVRGIPIAESASGERALP